MNRILLAVPAALCWMLLTGRLTPGAFAIGYLMGMLVLLVIPVHLPPLRWGRLPGQLMATGLYGVVMFRDITLSSIDVARRVLSPRMRLQPGIIAVRTQDPQKREVVAGLSAHNITITPGELVVEFDGSETMYVHCLDAASSGKTADQVQARRLRLIRAMMGDERGR